MLRIINEELIKYSYISKDRYGNDSTAIVTSEEIVRKYDQTEETKKNFGDSDVIPLNREICKINAPIVSKFIADPMRVRVSDNEKGLPQVEVSAINPTFDNKTNIFIVAFPFNGFVLPIPEDPKYRIYKGILASSSIPFTFMNKKYKKVLYLVIEPNFNLFKEDHKYHTDAIDITFESYFFNKASKVHTEKFTLSITDNKGTCTENWEFDDKNITEDTITPDEIVNKGELWTTFKFIKKDDGRKRYEKKYQNQRPSDGKEEEVIMVTKNKHGIRKEITRGNRKDDFYGKDESDYDNNKNHRRKKKPAAKKKSWR